MVCRSLIDSRSIKHEQTGIVDYGFVFVDLPSNEVDYTKGRGKLITVFVFADLVHNHYVHRICAH